MRRTPPHAQWLLLLMAGALVACGDPPPWQTEAAIEPICEKVMSCGGWGYADVEECQDGLVSNPALGTSCKTEQRYLDCVHDCCWAGCREVQSRDDCAACQPPTCNQCDALSCDAFTTCEQRCFERHCPPD